MSYTQPQSIGFGSCTGGKRPDPPIDDYPLLAWVKGVVCTEDNQTAVSRIAKMADNPNFDIVKAAAHLETTVAHMVQALAYSDLLD